MPSFFSRLKNKDGPSNATKLKKGGPQVNVIEPPPKPQWEDAWTRTSVEPEEVQELIRGCTVELKSRALDMPFLLLPFRPTSDPSAARNFIRQFFDRSQRLHGEVLAQELRLTEPMVLCSVVKWCWSRLAGGVVTWDSYELFRVGESDSNMARDSFTTFIPLSIDSDARTKIIFDFFDLLSAIAAHGKTNGLGGLKLSRLAGWWAFEHSDTGNGFEGGYKGWVTAADATSHLFFAYLRSLSPASVKGLNGISNLPMSLQKLVQETEYPPERPLMLQSKTTKVVMIVDSVSPTPFALLRRANHFQYRDEDQALQEFAEYEDPVNALTDECRRVLKSISSTNQSQISSSKDSTGLRDASWSRFEDIGFSGTFDDQDDDEDEENSFGRRRNPRGLRTTPHARNIGLGRPTTPSWADFLSSGFVDEAKNGPPPLLLPPDKILPPINTRGGSSQSHRPRLESNRNLEPGELASIKRFNLDDSFWWVWISSLAGEEPPERKAAFGRCALVETIIPSGRWLVMEEMVKGAAPAAEEGAYIAEKKSFWGRSKRTRRMSRSKSTGKQTLEQGPGYSKSLTVSKTTIGPDQHARIQAAAYQLQQQQLKKQQEDLQQQMAGRRGRSDADMASQKTNSVFTLQPVIVNEASSAMQWAKMYDKGTIREAYLANNSAGRGLSTSGTPTPTNGYAKSQDTLRPVQTLQRDNSRDRDLPAVPSSALPPTVPAKTPSPPPAVPHKAPSPPPAAPLPPTPAASKEAALVSEKAAEVPLPPQEPLPIQRKVLSGPTSPMPRAEPSFDNRRPSADPQTDSGSSPESKAKHNKLQKKENPGGFRKMFGRSKIRNSTMPDNAAGMFNGGQNGPDQGGMGLGRMRSGIGRKSVVSSPASESSAKFAPTPARPPPPPIPKESTPASSPQPQFDRSYDPSLRDSLSRVNTMEANEAKQAFSNFDQGPLQDVPAFVPEDSPRQSEDDVDAATPPPPIARKQSEDEKSEAQEEAKAPVVPVQDRWAQIRKNAAERAAQRQSEEQSRGGYSQKTDGDDAETSGEETIESRVARIKARVAELTGNMETTGGPGTRVPVGRG